MLALPVCLHASRKRGKEREREGERASQGEGRRVAVPIALSCALGRGLGGGACLPAACPCLSLLHASLACLPACLLASRLPPLNRQKEKARQENGPCPIALMLALPVCFRASLSFSTQEERKRSKVRRLGACRTAMLLALLACLASPPETQSQKDNVSHSPLVCVGAWLGGWCVSACLPACLLHDPVVLPSCSPCLPACKPASLFPSHQKERLRERKQGRERGYLCFLLSRRRERERESKCREGGRAAFPCCYHPPACVAFALPCSSPTSLSCCSPFRKRQRGGKARRRGLSQCLDLGVRSSEILKF